ncbi:hypothetical protein ACFVKB_47610 [Rhodococcus sp. NPDC127530]|uniref:hypothetical protein n=1 Tax=unclassified Rhodococcus (in: high G+C Gram-positive bacteria) TaxID=192944 RepID=UPI0036455CB0
MDELRTASTVGFAKHCHPPGLPVLRFTAQRVLPHKPVGQYQVDVGSSFPCRELSAGILQIEQDDPVRHDLPIGYDHLEIAFGTRRCGRPILQI